MEVDGSHIAGSSLVAGEERSGWGLYAQKPASSTTRKCSCCRVGQQHLHCDRENPAQERLDYTGPYDHCTALPTARFLSSPVPYCARRRLGSAVGGF